MISKEELMDALNALFPEGIPDACNEVMARSDSPFESYHELRKILGKTSAAGNRKLWVDTTQTEDVTPPKPKLLADLITNKNPDGLHLEKLVDYSGSELDAIITFLKDFNPGFAASSFTSKDFVPLPPAMVGDQKVNSQTLRNIKDASKDTVDISFNRVQLDEALFEDIPQSEWGSTNLANRGKQLALDYVKTITPVVVTDPTAEFMMGENNEYARITVYFNNSNILYGHITVTLIQKFPVVPVKFTTSWKDNKSTLQYKGDEVGIVVNVTEGTVSNPNNFSVSLDGHEDKEVLVTNYDSSNSTITLIHNYAGVLSDINIAGVIVKYDLGDSKEETSNVGGLTVVRTPEAPLEATWKVSSTLPLVFGDSLVAEVVKTSGEFIDSKLKYADGASNQNLLKLTELDVLKGIYRIEVNPSFVFESGITSASTQLTMLLTEDITLREWGLNTITIEVYKPTPVETPVEGAIRQVMPDFVIEEGQTLNVFAHTVKGDPKNVTISVNTEYFEVGEFDGTEITSNVNTDLMIPLKCTKMPATKTNTDLTVTFIGATSTNKFTTPVFNLVLDPEAS